jgi:hypothetical protein
MLRLLPQQSLLEQVLHQQTGLGTVIRTLSVLQPLEARHLHLFVEQTLVIEVKFAIHSETHHPGQHMFVPASDQCNVLNSNIGSASTATTSAFTIKVNK